MTDLPPDGRAVAEEVAAIRNTMSAFLDQFGADVLGKLNQKPTPSPKDLAEAHQAALRMEGYRQAVGHLTDMVLNSAVLQAAADGQTPDYKPPETEE